MKNEDSIKALIQLIDDPDEHIFEHVRDQLMSHGTKAISFLENSWETDDYGLIFQARIEAIIHDIQFNVVKDELVSWINSTKKDLLQGALIVAKYQYPTLDEDVVRKKIEIIRQDIWLEMNNTQTSFEKVRIFNRIFFEKHQFKGNSKNYHSPSNSFINKVLETKKGNPLSLSLIYSIIAQSLHLPIYGINLPNHFVLAYLDVNNSIPEDKKESQHGVLFYINPFSKGGIFDKYEIDAFLENLDKSKTRDFYEPCSNSAIIIRMLTNLIASFQQSGSSKKVEELVKLRDCFNLAL